MQLSTSNVWQTVAKGPWEARWSVAGVTSRLTMLGSEPATVYKLETYPLDNAVITPRNPPCQTLCVRRENHGEFLAVGDAWQDEPNLQSASAAQGGRGLVVRTKANIYHLLFGQGSASFTDGVSLVSDAAFTLLRDTNALMLVHGTKLAVESREGSLRIQLDKPATLSAGILNGAIRQEISGDIQFDTFGGVDHLRPAPEVRVTISGELWRAAKSR